MILIDFRLLRFILSFLGGLLLFLIIFSLFCGNMDCVHQTNLLQYPVRTALETKININDDMFFSSDAFITVNDFFNFQPYDETEFYQ